MGDEVGVVNNESRVTQGFTNLFYEPLPAYFFLEPTFTEFKCLHLLIHKNLIFGNLVIDVFLRNTNYCVLSVSVKVKFLSLMILLISLHQLKRNCAHFVKR